MNAGHGIANITISGGEPTASYSVVLNGNGTAITLTLNNVAEVTGGGLGFVTLPGVEHLSLNASGGNAVVQGTTASDTFDVRPTASDSLTVNRTGLNLTSDLANVGSVTVDALNAGAVPGDADTINVYGTATKNTIMVNRGATTTVSVDTLQAIDITASTAEALVVLAGLGADSFQVTGGGGPASITFDAGLPNASGAPAASSDSLSVTTQEHHRQLLD